MMYASITPEILQRLSGSLLHFLWEGALIALLTALALHLLARSSAEWRYAVSIAGLLMMAMAPPVTFIFYTNTGQAAAWVLGQLNPAIAEAGASANGAATTSLNGWIVMAWFGGVAVCLARLTVAWCVSRRLVRSADPAVPPALTRLFRTVANQLNVRKSARLLMSTRTPIPAVVGWLRPVVLLPVCALTNLNEGQLRAVLAHELAHIRRHDFLINTMQRCVESWLFYHPAVWWLSARIRTERELCCDDMVIRVCGDRVAYAEGLIQLERARIESVALTVAATGGPFTRRIRRILGHETMNRDLWSAAVAAAVLLVWMVGGASQVLTLEAKTAPQRAAASTTAAIRAKAPAEQNGPSSSRMEPASIDSFAPGAGSVLNSIAAIVTAQPIHSQPPSSPPTQAAPNGRTDSGVIQGLVTRSGSRDGIPDAEVTLYGPAQTIETLSSLGLYTPRAELTSHMRDKINANMTAYLAFPPQRVAEETRAYEARLLGLPAPAADTSSEARAAALPAPEPRKTATEADGRFTFDHLPPGFYRVVAQREGYFRDAAAFGNFVETAISDGRSLDVGSEKTTGVTLSLTPGGVIAGRVQDTGGRPLANFTVAAYQVAYREGRAVLEEVRTAAAPTAVSAQTDDHGEYRIVWLPPGAYYVAANPRRPFVATNCSALFAAACSPPASPQDVYVRTFPSDVKDAQMALPITLAPGKTVTGVDIKVQADATAKVSGRIVNPFIDTNGQATTSSTSLYLVNRDPGTMEANRVRAFPNRAPKGSGLFEIHNVPPGSYEIWATAPDGNGRTAWGNARVEIGERDVENVAIAIKSGSSVKIRLSVDGGPPQSIEVRAPAGGEQRQQPANSDSPAATARGPAPVIRPAIQVRLTPLDFPEGAASSANAGMTFDPAGIYTFPNVPEGRYRVTVSSLTPTSYVEDIRQGISIYDEGFTMSNAPAEIDVIVRTRGGGAIRGTVTSIAGLSLTHSAVVVLVPSFPHRNNVTLYKMTETTPAGDFEIFPIVPGEYTLLAWERAPSGAWTNADFLARFEQRGKAVTIKADGYTMADVIVIPASQTN